MRRCRAVKLLKRAPLFPSKTKGMNPDWANLPRRKCDDCGKGYKPVRPLVEGQRGFCSDTCRKSYHRHGGAYRKLRDTTEKLIERRLDELRADLKLIAGKAMQDFAFQLAEARIRQIVREEMTTNGNHK